MHICSHVLHRCFPTLVFPSSEAYKETKWFLFHVQWGSLRARYNANMMRRDFSCLPSLVQCCCVSDRRRLDWQVFVQSWGLGGKLDHNLVACEEEKMTIAYNYFLWFQGHLNHCNMQLPRGPTTAPTQVLMPLFERFASRAASSSAAG